MFLEVGDIFIDRIYEDKSKCPMFTVVDIPKHGLSIRCSQWNPHTTDVHFRMDDLKNIEVISKKKDR